MIRCIPHGIQQMPARHAHHHHQPIYNIDHDMGDLIPPTHPQPPRQPPTCLHGNAPHDPVHAAREPRAEPAQMAAARAARGSGAEPLRLAQQPRAEPAQGAVGTARPAEAQSDRVRNWDAVPDPLGSKVLPLVMAVHVWRSWATSGTTRGLRNRPFDAVLLRRDWGNRELPPGGPVAWEDQEGVLRAVIGAGWRDGGPDGVGFPGRGGSTPRHGRRGQCLATPGPAHRPQPLAPLPEEPATAAAANGGAGDRQAQQQWPDARWAEVPTPDSEHAGVGAGRQPGAPPWAGPGPPDPEPPPPSAVRAASHKEGKCNPRSWRPQRPRSLGRGGRRAPTAPDRQTRAAMESL